MFARPIDPSLLATATKTGLVASTSLATSRRGFLKVAAAFGGGLVLAAHVDLGRAVAAAMGDPPAPNAFVRIAPDSTVTVLIKHLDMGQGVTTGLTTIVAEELDADWGQMRFAFAPADAALYNNLAFGPIQGTGGSTSVFNSWTQLRQAGAAARAMLIAAAAAAWGVPAGEITIDKGRLAHASGKTGTFGEFAEAAAKLPVPAEPKLKDPKDFKLIGTRLPRLDTPDKITGKAIYSLDIRRPGQLTAVVAHPPRFGAKPKSFDATKAKAVKGVVDVVEIPSGVAVVAQDTWSAMQGREALTVEWDETGAESRSSDAIMAGYRALAGQPGIKAAARGDAAAALKDAAKVIEAEFEFPYLAHAPMEPLNGVIEPTADGVTIWAGSQFQTIEQMTVGGILGLKPEQVKIETLFSGGSFGRRATPTADYLAEAAQILKATGSKAPIHLVWTREDDMKAGYYRPTVYHKVRAGLDADGNVKGWDQVIVGKSIMIGTPLEMMVKDGVDPTTVEGAADTAYAIADLTATVHNANEGVPVLWWRSVGHTHTAHVVESMIDELATTAGKDPVAFRRDLLKDNPRHVAVLDLAAEKAGWGGPLDKGRGRGIALHESFQSFVAMVAEVAVADGKVKVERIVAAVDCGIAVNPDVVKAQVEGAVGFVLSAVTRNRITLADGEVEQANFDTYEPTRMPEMPKVEVHIVASAEAPTGIGEPGVPTVAPAIANAVFSATGKRLRSLPLDLSSLSAS